MHLNIPTSINKIVTALLRAKEYILVGASLVMAFTFFFIVILRYVFEADLFAYEEWILMIAFWLYFLGGAVGSYENTHVKADFLLSIIDSTRTKWKVACAVHLLEALIGGVISYWGWLMMYEEISFYPDWQRTPALGLPFIIPKLGIFLGFTLMTFYAALHFWSGLRDGPTAEWEADETPPHI